MKNFKEMVKAFWPLWVFAFFLGMFLGFCKANAGPLSGDLSLQTYQGDNPFLWASGEVKFAIPKTNFALTSSVLYGMYDLDTYASRSDWAYTIGATYDVGKHLTFNADYIYKTVDQEFMVYELENSPSMVRVGMTIHIF